MAMPSIPSEKGNASKVWEHKDHEFYYPLANTTAPGIQTDLKRRAWDQSKADVLVQAMKTSLNKSKDKEPGEFPIRTKLADLTTTPALRQMILTNHFELKTHDTTFYEYEVLDLEAAGQTRKKTQALFRKAIAEWSFLANNQDCFTTDGQKTIVSWKKLHELIDFPKVSVQSTNKTDEGLPFQIPITTGKTTITARFSYVGVVNIEDLLKQTQCDLSQIRKDLPSVERCINILISKSFNNDVVKSSGKKFYVRNARNALGTSKSLEIIRGYYYAVQPGIGSLLLNFNVATSAFFKPILVSDFLKDVETFGPHRFELIKRLRVYVEYEHKEKHLNNMGARIKGIVTLGNEPSENIEKLFFYKKLLGSDGKPYKLDNGEWAREKTPTTVAQHHWDGR
jgi:eukaryotic translation initiation factor 2C